jgi:branched-chain amino acid transport system substrate-binding protein
VLGLAYDPVRPGLEAIRQGAELAVSTLDTLPAMRARGLRFRLRLPRQGERGVVEMFERLRDDPAVLAVVGDAESGRTLDALPIVEDVGGGGARALVALSPTASSQALVGRSPWLFRLTPHDGLASAAVAEHVAGTLGARRAAVLYRNDPYGRDWAVAFDRAFAAVGGTTVARDPYVAGVTDWGIYASYLAALRPDVVVFPGSAEHAALFLRALRQAGATALVVGGDALAPLADSVAFAGTRYAVAFTPDHPPTPAARAFVAAFRARYGHAPGVRAALAYEATLLLGQAALASDPARAGARTRVRDWLAARGHGAPVAAGILGPVTFDAGHDVVGRGVQLATVAPEAALAGVSTAGLLPGAGHEPAPPVPAATARPAGAPEGGR